MSSYTAFGATGAQSSTGEVSVGARGATRQITNLAAGRNATDAANVGQLTGAASALGGSVATALGGGAAYNAVSGTVSAPSFTVAGTSYGSVFGALGALDGRATTTATTSRPTRPPSRPCKTAPPASFSRTPPAGCSRWAPRPTARGSTSPARPAAAP